MGSFSTFLSHPLFSPFAHLFFQIYFSAFSQPSAVFSFSLSSFQHLIHAAVWGAAQPIKGIVGELSRSEGCS